MIIILPLGRTFKSYLRLYGQSSPILNLQCKDCNCKLHRHGRYERYVTTKHQYVKIPIYRWYCPECGKTTAVLPDFLIPWARFTTQVRESYVSRKRRGFRDELLQQTFIHPRFGISTRTLKRWWKRHMQQVSLVSLWLAKKLTKAGTQQDLLGVYPRGVHQTSETTLIWLDKLLQVYPLKRSPIWGFWCALNQELPPSQRL